MGEGAEEGEGAEVGEGAGEGEGRVETPATGGGGFLPFACLRGLFFFAFGGLGGGAGREAGGGGGLFLRLLCRRSRRWACGSPTRSSAAPAYNRWTLSGQSCEVIGL